MAANLVAPLFYLGTVEAQATIAAFVLGAIAQTAIFASKGWVRLLGAGHLLWLPLVIWLGLRLDWGRLETAFELWVAAVVVLDSISLAIDGVETLRYLGGERTPVLLLDDASS